VAEVRAINRELVICIELGFEIVLGLPWVGGGGLKDEHAMVDCRTGEVAIHVLLWGRLIGIDVCCEDNVPQATDLMEFWCPEIVAVRSVLGWCERELDVGVVPVTRHCHGQQGSGNTICLDSYVRRLLLRIVMLSFVVYVM
jgi:hypothetical protein